ncbi:uncharacterized protein N7473_003003 [Penicillium subrubescens]|uniref:uncharacterized protein n=1 Tax=Penicillium subrubescens TaxID=1316194 RepID=UPI002544EF2C|nr:uncharacterized protein N7473_003003 [Penicillium subrubescens]KAJ5906087.1 hypothetical protein N7473_003003 [Penicillium subrubescens]
MYAISLAAFVLPYFIATPLITYYYDAKGLRKYPNFTFFSVLRIGPNALSISDLRDIKDIYGHGTTCIKDRFYSETAGTHAHLADVVDKSDHARKRKVLSSAYALKNLEEWEFKVADVTGKLIKAFDPRCTGSLSPGTIPETKDLTVDYRNWTVLFAATAIANIGLSEDLGLLDEGSDQDCHVATARVSYQLVWVYDRFKTLKRVSQLISPNYQRMWKLDGDWGGIVYNRATTRLKRYMAGEELDDFFTAMMEDKNGAPQNLEWGEIVAEINIMMNAGHDTTAISLRNNLTKSLNEDEVVASYGKIKHLPYLRACIDESLRMLPPVIFGLPRRTPLEGALILDDFIAGDISVSMSATGARDCIGRSISYLEQTVLIASLVHHYEFALPSADWDPAVRETTNLSWSDATEDMEKDDRMR